MKDKTRRKFIKQSISLGAAGSAFSRGPFRPQRIPES